MTHPATTTAEQGNGQAVATRTASPIGQLRSLLEKAMPQIKLALPRHLSAERMLRVCLTAAQRTPDLLKCDQLSFVGAVVQASQLGLEPDGILGHAYLVPFNNRQTGRKEVQLIAGYKGLIDLARRSGHVASISAHVVYEKDRFTFSYGIEDKLEHVPHMGKDRGQPLCVYAVARLKDGGYAFDVMSLEDVEKVRSMSKAGTKGPWVDHWPEMAKKTAIRRLVKYLPLSPELQKAVSLDELADAGVPQSLDIEVDASEVVAEATERRQAELRERHGGGATGGSEGDGDDAPEVETGEVASPEAIQRLNTLIDQLDQAAGEGKGMQALESAIGHFDLEAITAAQAEAAEKFLRNALATKKQQPAGGQKQGALV